MKRSSVNGRLVVLVAGVGLAVGLALPAMAWQDTQPPAEEQSAPRQPRQPRQRPAAKPPTSPVTPPTVAPGQPGAPAAAPVIPKTIREPGPYIAKGKSNDWRLVVDVDVKSDRSSDWISPDGGKTKMPYVGNFEFESLAMVFMLPPETAGARADDRSLKGQLKIDDAPVSTRPVLLDRQMAGSLYHSGVRLVRFNSETPATCREIEIEFEISMTCWETLFDEEKARGVKWPTGPWPEAAAATLGPQIFVNYERTRDKNGQPVTGEYDPAVVKRLVDEWTGGDPRSATPVDLAKFFAGKVAGMVQPTGLGLKFQNTGQLQGFGLQGAVATLQRGRGSEFDMTTALVALYRAAGLPARLVIGYEKADTRDKSPSEFLRGGSGTKESLRSWAEFCLYDEVNGTVNWVPVDVVALRKKTGGRAPDINKPWPYFGENEDLDNILPLALGFHPPTTVESYGAPALWGWLMKPAAPTTAFQAVRFVASSSSVRGDDKKDEKKKKNR